MSDIKIEKGVPIPERAPRGGSKPKYPWAQLEVGDSFVIAGRNERTVRGHVSEQAMRHGIKLTVRKIDPMSVRVWRIA